MDGIPLGEWQPWISEAPELEDFKKDKSPEIINFLLLCNKRKKSSSPKGTPRDPYVVEQWSNLFRNAMELGGVPQNMHGPSQ